MYRFRYTGTSAAVNTWDQQEDDRGPGGLFRLLGEGTSPPQHNQRWVPSFFPSSSSSSSFFSRYIPISRKTFLLSFFFSLSLFCSLLFMHISRSTGFSTISNYPLIAVIPIRELWRFHLKKHIFSSYISIYRLLVSLFFFFLFQYW